MYVFQANQIEATINKQSDCRLTIIKHATVAEKPVSFRVVSPRIMITGIETIIR